MLTNENYVYIDILKSVHVDNVQYCMHGNKQMDVHLCKNGYSAADIFSKFRLIEEQAKEYS